jgi:hypothetical protein
MLGDTLTELEQAKSSTVDQRYLSRFWETMTGEGGRLDIIDYICPHCHNNIWWNLWTATYCPHCDTPIFSAPRRKLDAKQFRNWRHTDMEGLRHAKTGNRAGAKAVPPRDHKLRSGQSPARKSRLKHCLP